MQEIDIPVLFTFLLVIIAVYEILKKVLHRLFR